MYRLTVVLLSIILVLIILSTAEDFFKQPKMQDYGKLVVNTNADGNVLATNRLDNTTLKVEYAKDKDKYTLYRDDVEYSLSATKYGNNLVVDLNEASTKNYEGIVVGQCPLAIPLVLWTPALIEAAQLTISATIAVVGTYTVWYSIDSIEKAIVSTKSDVKVQENEQSKKVTGYYAAVLVGGKVAINRPITYAEAVTRLIAGMDVFATSKMAASSASFAATAPNQKAVFHLPHGGGEGFYPHFHPGGRNWINNKNYLPHCWFGVTP
ncbi:MAG: hypothetical protein PHO88_02500 [Clostridia bacterium]|nr:hypothetical protein [Clostridia bacterium]